MTLYRACDTSWVSWKVIARIVDLGSSVPHWEPQHVSDLSNLIEPCTDLRQKGSVVKVKAGKKQ